MLQNEDMPPSDRGGQERGASPFAASNVGDGSQEQRQGSGLFPARRSSEGGRSQRSTLERYRVQLKINKGELPEGYGQTEEERAEDLARRRKKMGPHDRQQEEVH